MLSFLFKTWVSITLLVIALMSGALSIVREVALLYWPDKFHERTVFWACVRIAVVAAGGLLLWTQHMKIRDLQGQLDKSKPRFDGEITEAFITVPKSWDTDGNEHFRLKDSLVFLRVSAWNTVDMSPTSVREYGLQVAIDGKQYAGKPAPYNIALQGLDGRNYLFDGSLEQFTVLLYLRKLPGNVIFFIEGLKCEAGLMADLTLTLIDLCGVSHRIAKTNCDLQLGPISVMR